MRIVIADRVTTSNQAAVPSRMPTAMSPTAVSATIVPSLTSAIGTSPFAVLAVADICGQLGVARNVIDHDDPETSYCPKAAGPIKADVAHGRLEPALAELAVCREMTERRVCVDLRTRWDLDGDVDHFFAPKRRVPPPVLRRLDQQPPVFAHSTVVCSTALTSPAFEGSPGRTTTTVSTRSLAVIRTSPTRSTVTMIGSGVGNVPATRPHLLRGWFPIELLVVPLEIGLMQLDGIDTLSTADVEHLDEHRKRYR